MTDNNFILVTASRGTRDIETIQRALYGQWFLRETHVGRPDAADNECPVVIVLETNGDPHSGFGLVAQADRLRSFGTFGVYRQPSEDDIAEAKRRAGVNPAPLATVPDGPVRQQTQPLVSTQVDTAGNVIVGIEIGGVELQVFASLIDGVPVVEFDVPEDETEFRVFVNDGLVFSGPLQ